MTLPPTTTTAPPPPPLPPPPPPTTVAPPPPPPAQPVAAVGLDPDYGTCKEAKAHGAGPYYSGQDPEYNWYRDADSDGIVCE
ncbi:MAG: excalibur calcium-binding domain-containing protein [Ilumatobacteraceae bacterium]